MDAYITEEMEKYYDQRTSNHVERVRKNMDLMEGYFGFDLLTLNNRGIKHDASKFSEFERMPYIILTWKHYKKKTKGMIPEYPDWIEDEIQSAVQHHLCTNRHHPEYFDHPYDIDPLDMVEMVCDWTAMSQEFGELGCSKYFSESLEKGKWQFLPDQITFIRETIHELNKRLGWTWNMR